MHSRSKDLWTKFEVYYKFVNVKTKFHYLLVNKTLLSTEDSQNKITFLKNMKNYEQTQVQDKSKITI